MSDSHEQKLSIGLHVLDMTKTEGWRWLEGKIREEIKIETIELREFDLEGRTVEEIASKYLQHRSNLNAYENVLAMVGNAITGREEAARALRDS